MSTPAVIAVIGGGPAGLMAAEQASQADGVKVHVFDAMPSLGRKFQMAGKGGMNITHAEAPDRFRSRYGERQREIAPLLEAFGPEALRAWMHGLGVDSFVGSSGRVFPVDMKAAPLLRSWLHRLRDAGSEFHVRHRWLGIGDDALDRFELVFATPQGETRFPADAVVLALGGGSWAKLGSDGRWVETLERLGVEVSPLRPANCGFEISWSDYLRARFSGEPVKNIVASAWDSAGEHWQRPGELVVTEHGVEGGVVYALAKPLREAIEASGEATLTLDLLPAYGAQRVFEEVARPRGSRSLATHLHSRLGLKGVKVALLREVLGEAFFDHERLARAIKALPLPLKSTRPLDEAISSAGGVVFEALDAKLMLQNRPGIFCAGEMLDWEAPTGGYLLTACFASGHAAGQGLLRWLRRA